MNLFKVLNFRLLLYVKYHLLILEDSYREVIGSHYQLILSVLIPIHELNRGRIVTSYCPESFISSIVEASDRAITTCYDHWGTDV